jgi:hypothetical protein
MTLYLPLSNRSFLCQLSGAQQDDSGTSPHLLPSRAICNSAEGSHQQRITYSPKTSTRDYWSPRKQCSSTGCCFSKIYPQARQESVDFSGVGIPGIVSVAAHVIIAERSKMVSFDSQNPFSPLSSNTPLYGLVRLHQRALQLHRLHRLPPKSCFDKDALRSCSTLRRLPQPRTVIT